MLSSSVIQHRAKQINLLLARELTLIKREHLQNVNTHRKLENTIRRDSDQSIDKNRMKISLSFNQIYNEQTGSIDYDQIRDSNINSTQKFRLSFGASSSSSSSSSSSPNQTNFDRNDEFSDDTSSCISFRRRRYCSKAQPLPSIIKANVSNQPKRENKTQNCMTSLPETNKIKEDHTKRFTIINDEVSEPILPELTPIQQQVRSFLETLPAYKGVQHGFDSFAPASLYSTRGPIVIR